MASRRKRKRERRKAEATVESSRNIGFGQGVPLRHWDLAMIRKAIREGWPIPTEVRKAVVRDLSQALDEGASEPESERKASLSLDVMHLVVELEGLNQEQEYRAEARAWPTREKLKESTQ